MPELASLIACCLGCWRITLNCLDAEVTAKGKTGVEGPLRTTASTGGLKELPGGTGGKVLTLSIIQAHGQPKLVLWASTTANFSSTG